MQYQLVLILFNIVILLAAYFFLKKRLHIFRLIFMPIVYAYILAAFLPYLLAWVPTRWIVVFYSVAVLLGFLAKGIDSKMQPDTVVEDSLSDTWSEADQTYAEARHEREALLETVQSFKRKVSSSGHIFTRSTTELETPSPLKPSTPLSAVQPIMYIDQDNTKELSEPTSNLFTRHKERNDLSVNRVPGGYSIPTSYDKADDSIALTYQKAAPEFTSLDEAADLVQPFESQVYVFKKPEDRMDKPVGSAETISDPILGKIANEASIQRSILSDEVIGKSRESLDEEIPVAKQAPKPALNGEVSNERPFEVIEAANEPLQEDNPVDHEASSEPGEAPGTSNRSLHLVEASREPHQEENPLIRDVEASESIPGQEVIAAIDELLEMLDDIHEPSQEAPVDFLEVSDTPVNPDSPKENGIIKELPSGMPALVKEAGAAAEKPLVLIQNLQEQHQIPAETAYLDVETTVQTNKQITVQDAGEMMPNTETIVDLQKATEEDLMQLDLALVIDRAFQAKFSSDYGAAIKIFEVALIRTPSPKLARMIADDIEVMRSKLA